MQERQETRKANLKARASAKIQNRMRKRGVLPAKGKTGGGGSGGGGGAGKGRGGGPKTARPGFEGAKQRFLNQQSRPNAKPKSS